MLLEALQVKRTASRTPLFDVAFALDPVPSVTLPGLTVADMALDYVHSNFDFTLRMREDKDRVIATVEYNSRLFEAVTMHRLLEAFRTLLGGAGVAPDQTIAALPLLSEVDRRQLLVEWNDGPREATIDAGLDAIALRKLRLARQKRVQSSGGAASA